MLTDDKTLYQYNKCSCLYKSKHKVSPAEMQGFVIIR